jgi:hypothetical protein
VTIGGLPKNDWIGALIRKIISPFRGGEWMAASLTGRRGVGCPGAPNNGVLGPANLALEKVHRTEYAPFGMAGKPIWLPVQTDPVPTSAVGYRMPSVRRGAASV